ncbi:hypothetical protein [Arachnia propionica]|uniref:hypothetical protein n=1 Tax=Arachnia propionica TaxID=1750 RepID=UPI0016394E65|nr:hypothetical protein [Arachnia propionica]MDO5083699.1 hypothetical protein [Arachnia propionica]
MCRKVTCKECHKPTWAGCGQHVEQALAGVPASERCVCDQGTQPSGVISKLLGKR